MKLSLPSPRTRFSPLGTLSGRSGLSIVLALLIAGGAFAQLVHPRGPISGGTDGPVGDATASMLAERPQLAGPTADAPLAARLTLSTRRPTRILLDVAASDESWQVASTSEPKSAHAVPILGLAPAKEYFVQNIRIIDSNGRRVALPERFTIRTAPLPPDFPRLTVWRSDTGRVEPGYLLTSVLRGRPGRATARYTLIVDRRGTPRWFCARSMLPVERRPGGTFFGLDSDLFRGAPCELDVFGQVLRKWGSATVHRSADAVAGDGRMHHEAVLLPSGNVLTFHETNHMVPNFPTSDRDPRAPKADRLVSQDAIVEVRRDGTIANRIDLLSRLDPYRFGYDAVRPKGYQDWAHGNAITYDQGDADDPDDDAILVSLRNQDAIIKLAYPSGRLVWILGTHAGWSPRFHRYLLHPPADPDFEWPFHQHAPTLLADNQILLFDNGNHRATPLVTMPRPPDASYSRAVQYAIDDATRRITQVWQFGGRDLPASERIYSPFSGDADRLPETNNVLVTFARPEYVGGTRQRRNRPQIVEVTDRGERLFVMQVAYDDADASVYRTANIKSIYPPGYRVSPGAGP